MKVGNTFSAIAYILNFAIILYFIFSSLGTECIPTKNILISFFALFASLVANIISILDSKK